MHVRQKILPQFKGNPLPCKLFLGIKQPGFVPFLSNLILVTSHLLRRYCKLNVTYLPFFLGIINMNGSPRSIHTPNEVKAIQNPETGLELR